MSIGIVAVAYNRKNSLSRLLDSLNSAYYDKDVDLIISVDKSNTNEVENLADDYVWQHGSKKVIKHSSNMGLKKHILGLGALFDTYDALVILEDDLIVSKHFFRYTQQTVSKYSNDSKIAGISLYGYQINYENYLPFTPIDDGYSTYFIQCASSWGEVWMKRQWLDFFEWYKKHEDFDFSPDIPENIFRWGNKSWLRYHTRYCVECDKYFVFPKVSLTTNYCDAGTNHASNQYNNPTVHQVPLQYGTASNFTFPCFEEGTKYDVFFENEKIYKSLGLSVDECCVDLYGKKNRNKNQRFWLTMSRQKYAVVKSFGLFLRPIEANILMDVEGDEIFLYDTTVKSNKEPGRKTNYIPYFYRIRYMPDFIFKYGIIRLSCEFGVMIWNKIIRTLGLKK